ncbi:hypothetical protein GJ699_03815 [Duganella sp. FT80W]|uniref:Uncharacterized protein n=1 Tax=Duganella guangzhouensis TaxID=2666084 RepID=A0A6I2KT69_9BURK|nr:hypothetical protein [Duganella guangzhouensis]MRW89105.1 hypothetical protein [Duganella guangzhouensis]
MTSHQLQRARSTLAECARWLVVGRISNYEFDDAVPSSPDPTVSAIYEYFWMLYCDMREYRLTGPDELSPLERDKAVRCILFLKSGLPYSWPVLSRAQSALLTLLNLLTLGAAGRIYSRRVSVAGDVVYWPFISESQYAQALQAPAYLAGGAKLTQ